MWKWVWLRIWTHFRVIFCLPEGCFFSVFGDHSQARGLNALGHLRFFFRIVGTIIWINCVLTVARHLFSTNSARHLFSTNSINDLVDL
jgi:hypothetical protein